MNLNSVNTLVSLTIGAGVIISGAVASFFLVRSQVTKVLREELEVYKEKVERLSEDIQRLQITIKAVTTDNLALVSERDYLRSLIVSALTTRETVGSNILEDALKKIDKRMVMTSNELTIDKEIVK